MNDIAFYVFLFIHLVSLITGFGSVIVVDTFGLLWLLKIKGITLERVNSVAAVTQRLIWIGWGGLVFSGLFLITMKGYVDNLTKIKLFFVLMIGLNGIFLHFIKKGLERLKDQEKVPALYMFRIALASTISQLGWWGALSIGFVHRHWEHNIPWPPDPFIYIGVIILLIGLVALVGESLLAKKR
jgi:membrane-associated protease RseP (regulator of RpoE activity)